MNKTKKILFIDSWTKGIHNFLPIANELQKIGWEALLVHRGSWEHDRGRPLEEKIDGMLVRDIRFYNTKYIYNVFKQENPKIILILTTNYFFDRVVILAAKALSIKTVFLMHGLRTVTKEVNDGIKNTPVKKLFRKRWLNSGKYFRYVIPNYFAAGVLNDLKFLFKIKSYSIIIKLFLKPHRYVLFPPISDEIHCDLALVWGNIYKQFFIREYGYPEDRVKVVGHPPLDSVFNLLKNPPDGDDKLKFINSHKIPIVKPYCVLLESGVVEQGTPGWDQNSLIEFIKQVAKCCSETDNNLVIKLHPFTVANPIINVFARDNHVIVLEEIDINKLIYFSNKVIGQNSTTNDIAIVMKKQLLIPAWGISEKISLAAINKQKSAILCKSTEELAIQLLNKYNDKFEKIRSKYMEDFITYTDGKAIDRISKNLISLATK